MKLTVESLQAEVDVFISQNGGLDQPHQKVLDMQLKALEKTDFPAKAAKLARKGFGQSTLVKSIVDFTKEWKKLVGPGYNRIFLKHSSQITS